MLDGGAGGGGELGQGVYQSFAAGGPAGAGGRFGGGGGGEGASWGNYYGSAPNKGADGGLQVRWVGSAPAE